MTDNRTTELRKLLDERGVEWSIHDERTITNTFWENGIVEYVYYESLLDGYTELHMRDAERITPEQAIAATLGRPKAKSHPYGYERDTGAYDCTRCECGCINDISAAYCNDCGGEIEIDKSAEKEYYDGYSKHTVFAKKHDDGSLEFCERRYVPEDVATLGRGECEYKPMWDEDDPLAEEYLGMWHTGCGDVLTWNADNDGCCEPPAFCPYCGKAVKR